MDDLVDDVEGIDVGSPTKSTKASDDISVTEKKPSTKHKATDLLIMPLSVAERNGAEEMIKSIQAG